jgi:hypothetical protein
MMNHSQQYRNVLFSVFLVLATATAFAPSGGKAGFRHHNNPLYSSSTTMDGLIKTVSKRGLGKPAVLGDIATVKYICYLPDDEKAMPFARSEKQKMVNTYLSLR